MKIKNESGVLNARYGKVLGKIYVFTHRNPANGDVFAEYCVGDQYSKNTGWYPYDMVEWL